MPTTYDSHGNPSTADVPVSRLVGVNVMTFWEAAEQTKNYALYSLVAEGRPAETIASFSGRAVALKVSGAVSDTTNAVSEVGLVSLDGTTARNTTASANVQSVHASFSPGTRVNGLCQLSSSAGVAAACESPLAAGSLKDSSTNVFGSFASANVADVEHFTNNGLPVVGRSNVAGNPVSVVKAGLAHAGGAPDVAASNVADIAYAFTARPLGSAATGRTDLRMTTGRPLVWVDKGTSASTPVCGNASSPTITALNISTRPAQAVGYGTAPAGAAHLSTACVVSQVQTVHAFPTDFAQDGVVKLGVRAQATCRTNGAAKSGGNPNGGQALFDFTGSVTYWEHGFGYRTVAISPSQPLDPDLLEDTFVTPTLKLKAYVASWAALSAGDATSRVLIDQDKKSVQADLPAALTLQSAALTDDASSTVALELGRVACTAEDNR